MYVYMPVTCLPTDEKKCVYIEENVKKYLKRKQKNAKSSDKNRVMLVHELFFEKQKFKI